MDEFQLEHALVSMPDGDVSVKYANLGHKKTCVCVHGFMSNGYWWHWVVPYLVRYYNVIIIDLPGMGQSQARTSYSLSDMGKAINAVISHFQHEMQSIQLIGHSLGALASSHAIIQNPSQIKTFQCIDMDLNRLQDETHHQFIDTPRRYYADQASLVKRFRLVPAETDCHQEDLEYLAQHSMDLFEQGWAWSFDPNILNIEKNNVLATFIETMKAHPIQTQFVIGDKTSVLNEAKAVDHWQAIMANTQIKIMPGYHHLMLDDPKTLASIIHQFISEQNE